MRWPMLATVLVLTASFVATPATATENQPPVPAAGLDQHVATGTTVYLDAGGSYDPDGEIDAVDWAITPPNGSTVHPSCRDCLTPTFTPDARGRWAVTVTVTDDDGATASDTLFVTVEEPRGPTVTVDSPSTATRGAEVPFAVEATDSDVPLREANLYHDGDRVDRVDLAGTDDLATASHTFESTGTQEVRAVVTDENGDVNTAVTTLDVVGPGGSDGTSEVGGDGPTAATASTGGGYSGLSSCGDGEHRQWVGDGSGTNGCTESSYIYEGQDGTTYVLPGDSGGITLYSDEQAEHVVWATESQVDRMQTGNSALTMGQVRSAYEQNKEDGKYDDRTDNVDYSLNLPEDPTENMESETTESVNTGPPANVDTSHSGHNSVEDTGTSEKTSTISNVGIDDTSTTPSNQADREPPDNTDTSNSEDTNSVTSSSSDNNASDHAPAGSTTSYSSSDTSNSDNSGNSGGTSTYYGGSSDSDSSDSDSGESSYEQNYPGNRH